jgi:phage baseplate assembly protein W
MNNIQGDNDAIIGVGWSFPPRFTNLKGEVVLSSGIEDIRESLHSLLATIQGERVMEPGYGCNVSELLFEPVSTTTKTYIAGLIKQAVLLYEPRVTLNECNVDTSMQHEGKVEIRLVYTVRTTNSRFNMVYPFYINEKTEQ